MSSALEQQANLNADPLVTGEPDAMETVATPEQQRSLSERIAEQVRARQQAHAIDDSDKVGVLLDQYAYAYKELNGHFPMLMHEECFEYLGERCSIVEVNVYDTLKNAEVVIETSNMQREEVQFKRLSWALGRVLGRIVFEGKLLLF